MKHCFDLILLRILLVEQHQTQFINRKLRYGSKVASYGIIYDFVIVQWWETADTFVSISDVLHVISYILYSIELTASVAFRLCMLARRRLAE